MKKLFSYKNKKQRGVALVFTLGILGLLTVIALGFASTALINRKVAENCANISYAQTIARSIALARAQYALQNIAAIEQFYSTSTTNPTYDWLWKLDTSLQGAQLFQYKYTSVSSGVNAVDWVYVRNPSDDPNSNGGRILGRYAYVVIPDKGRLDPSVNIADGSTITGASEKQIGINDTTWSNSLKTAITTSPNYRWTTFWEIFNKLGIVKGTADWDKWVVFFQDGINIGQLKSPEAYWVDSNSNGKRDSGEPLYRRFNLNRLSTDPNNWANLTVDELIGSDNTAFTSADALNVMTGIPWLKNWSSYAAASTLSSDWTAVRMQKQIAANIIQYNRAGDKDTPTVSDQSADWVTTTTPPTYAGVGKHPMLNELGFKFNVQATLTSEPYPAASPTAYDYTLTYSFNVSFGVELIDMFGIGTKADSEIYLPEWAVNATYSWVDVSKGSGSSPLTFNNLGQFGVVDTPFNSGTEVTADKKHIIPGATGWNTGYTKVIDASSSNVFWKDFNVTKTITFRIDQAADHSAYIKTLLKIKDISITPGRAVLKYDYNTAGDAVQRDYANLPPSNATTSGTEYDATTETTFSYALETTDPRVNHYSTDWTGVPDKNLYMTTTAGDDYLGSEGACNSTVSGTIHASNRDLCGLPTINPDPAYGATRLSSAFIRNGTMQSVWELGCISRAEAWRTLNLTRTNIAASPDYAYGNGDGKILDQVKLTEATPPQGPNFKYGKVNINSDVQQVFQALTDTTIPSGYTLERFTWFNSGFETGTSSQTNLLDVTTGTNLNTTSTPIIPAAPHADTCECLACLMKKRSKILPFNNRSELLVGYDDPTNTADISDIQALPGYPTISSDSSKVDKLREYQRKVRNKMLAPLSGVTPTTKAAQEQLLGKLMPLLRAETSDMVYVIVLAQTIRDIGGTPAYIDWNEDESYAAYSAPVSDAVSLKKAGYIRTGESTSYVSGASVHETYPAANTAVGTYEIGADKITSETKLIAVLVQDPVTRKWRIARYQYVE